MTRILYFLIWHTSCNSWCGVQHTVFHNVAYILYFLMWRTIYCIAWCGAYIVLQTYKTFPDMAFILPDVTYFLYFLMWRMMNSIYWYGVHPVFPDVTYFLYFLMWLIIYCISWCGVYIGRHTCIAFPVMAYRQEECLEIWLYNDPR